MCCPQESDRLELSYITYALKFGRLPSNARAMQTIFPRKIPILRGNFDVKDAKLLQCRLKFIETYDYNAISYFISLKLFILFHTVVVQYWL